MIAFIKQHRGVCGVAPICRVLQIAPSTFYAHLAVENDPAKASDRVKRDAELRPEMKRVWKDNRSVYGARKLWHAMKREKFDVARCTIERLMRDIGIEGVRRGKKIKTTWPDKALPCPLDRVNRQFRAMMPNQLWVSDFTYVSTWQGFVYVVIPPFLMGLSRRIHAAVFSFMAGVIPPIAMLGRSLLYVQSHFVA
jgi:hypothetical protein